MYPNQQKINAQAQPNQQPPQQGTGQAQNNKPVESPQVQQVK